MKFSDAVRHLENAGLIVEGATRRPRSGRRALRNPPRVVHVRAVKNGALPKELLQMIRESRAYISRPFRPRKHR